MFTQLIDILPWKTFHRIVTRYDGDHRVQTLSCAEHFRILAFAQLIYPESLRDIEAVCLQKLTSFITWVSANRFLAEHLLMPMPNVIGASMPNLLNG